ncbi:MAG: pentapeptide repeat-containing protein [Chloroflexi bacterium]|nr:pentapeptide repeat-containing protein [Chloroflexota bacterium]
MANPEHVKVVRQGAEAIARWRKNNQRVALDLSQADLSGADLIDANLIDDVSDELAVDFDKLLELE